VEAGFVGVTGADISLQDQEEPTPKNETETAGDQLDIAKTISPEEGFRFATFERPNS
jgi:hypothetical protein